MCCFLVCLVYYVFYVFYVSYHLLLHVSTYVRIYAERERERERELSLSLSTYICVYIYIYICYTPKPVVISCLARARALPMRPTQQVSFFSYICRMCHLVVCYALLHVSCLSCSGSLHCIYIYIYIYTHNQHLCLVSTFGNVFRNICFTSSQDKGVAHGADPVGVPFGDVCKEGDPFFQICFQCTCCFLSFLCVCVFFLCISSCRLFLPVLRFNVWQLRVSTALTLSLFMYNRFVFSLYSYCIVLYTITQHTITLGDMIS